MRTSEIDEAEVIRDVLGRYLEARGMRPATLAHEIGCHESVISRMQQPDPSKWRRPTVERAVRIHRVLRFGELAVDKPAAHLTRSEDRDLWYWATGAQEDADIQEDNLVWERLTNLLRVRLSAGGEPCPPEALMWGMARLHEFRFEFASARTILEKLAKAGLAERDPYLQGLVLQDLISSLIATGDLGKALDTCGEAEALYNRLAEARMLQGLPINASIAVGRARVAVYRLQVAVRSGDDEDSCIERLKDIIRKSKDSDRHDFYSVSKAAFLIAEMYLFDDKFSEAVRHCEFALRLAKVIGVDVEVKVQDPPFHSRALTDIYEGGVYWWIQDGLFVGARWIYMLAYAAWCVIRHEH